MVLQCSNIALKSPWTLFVGQLEIKLFSKSKSNPTALYVPLEFTNAVNEFEPSIITVYLTVFEKAIGPTKAMDPYSYK